MEFKYDLEGTCPTQVKIVFNEITRTIQDVKFDKGCPGMHEAVNRLIQGLYIDDVAPVLEGITCHKRPTSCADQLAKALYKVQQEIALRESL